MWAFSEHTNPADRGKAKDFLMRAPLAVQLLNLTPSSHRAALTRYNFVASPPGNGLDTHRTWEAIYLGCVPILTRSYMAEMYESMGLPIWVVSTFEEITQISEHELQAKFDSLKPLFESSRIWAKFWIDEIRNYQS